MRGGMALSKRRAMPHFNLYTPMPGCECSLGFLWGSSSASLWLSVGSLGLSVGSQGLSGVIPGLSGTFCVLSGALGGKFCAPFGACTVP